MAGFKAIARLAPVVFAVQFTPGEVADAVVFVADRDYFLESIAETHIAGDASSTAMVEKVASGVAAGSGVDLLSSVFALDSTANTPVVKTLANGGVISTASTRLIRRGESLAVDFTGTLTNYDGSLTFVLRPKGNN